MSDIVSGIIAIVGTTLVLLAGIGVLRFPDLYSRMHAATKAQTMGILLVSLAAIVVAPRNSPKLALIAIVVFVTAPVAAHLLGRSAYRPGRVELDVDVDDDLEGLDATSEERAR